MIPNCLWKFKVLRSKDSQWLEQETWPTLAKVKVGQTIGDINANC